MAVKWGLLALLYAKPDKGPDLEAFLERARTNALAEDATVTWYAFSVSETMFGIFDTFESEDGRQAHLLGQIPAALAQVGPDLLARDADLLSVEIVAAKPAGS
jgi:hypothetical protein